MVAPLTRAMNRVVIVAVPKVLTPPKLATETCRIAPNVEPVIVAVTAVVKPRPPSPVGRIPREFSSPADRQHQ